MQMAYFNDVGAPRAAYGNMACQTRQIQLCNQVVVQHPNAEYTASMPDRCRFSKERHPDSCCCPVKIIHVENIRANQALS